MHAKLICHRSLKMPPTTPMPLESILQIFRNFCKFLDTIGGMKIQAGCRKFKFSAFQLLSKSNVRFIVYADDEISTTHVPPH